MALTTSTYGVAGAVALAVTAVALVAPGSGNHVQADAAAASRGTTVVTGPAGQTGLAGEIGRTQDRLRRVPGDWQSWATLGLDYVEQAKATVDPAYYPKAAAALERSLRLERRDNFIAMAGESALAAARHDFTGARRWARRGLAIDPASAVLHGALADALTQLGRYRAAAAAARQMETLRPGSDAEARLSYAAELRGDLPAARRFMRAALAHAVGPYDVAFARYYLGELALNNGNPRLALRHDRAGLLADPGYPALREGRAKALAALGRTSAAVREFRRVVATVPQPSYLLELARLLTALGRDRAAAAQLAVFRTEERLFRANGVALDTDRTLFEAQYGDPLAAVRSGRAALRTRPFLESHDALGWALHRAGHDRAALAHADAALSTGLRSALFHFHRGVIAHALGRDVQAARDLRAALRLNPAFDPLDAPAARHLLATLRSHR